MPPPKSLVARLAAENHGALDACVGNADGSVLLVRHGFAASEGRMGDGDGVRIGLLTAGGGTMLQRTALGRIERPWLPGQFNVALPGCDGEYRSPALELLGLVIDARYLERSVAPMRLQDLHLAASDLQRDPVVATVLAALWHCADAHAGSAAFFDHGVAIILQRLKQIGDHPVAAPPATQRLSAARLARVRDFIDSRLGEDINVARMAQEAGQDSSRFSRGFRQATGVTPYAYLTQRRMQAAKKLLAAGHAVTEVALAMGYANPSKFAAAFRRVIGLSPTAWGQASVHSNAHPRPGTSAPATGACGTCVRRR